MMVEVQRDKIAGRLHNKDIGQFQQTNQEEKCKELGLPNFGRGL